MPMITNYIKLAKQRLKKSLGFVIRLGKKLFSWLLELTIWASCLAWISSDCFESFSSLSNVWIDQPLTLYRDVTTTRKPGSDFDWSHSFAWYSADRIGGMLVEFKHFDNLYRKQQNCPGLRNWIAQLNCEWRILRFPQWFCLWEVSETNFMLSIDFLAIFTVKGVMILLAFLSCFLAVLFSSSGTK